MESGKWKNEFQNPGIFDTAVFDTSPCACTGTVAPGPQRRQAQTQQPAQTASFEASGRSRFISTAAYGFLSWASAVGTLTRGVGLRLRGPLGHFNGSSEYHQIPERGLLMNQSELYLSYASISRLGSLVFASGPVFESESHLAGAIFV